MKIYVEINNVQISRNKSIRSNQTSKYQQEVTGVQDRKIFKNNNIFIAPHEDLIIFRPTVDNTQNTRRIKHFIEFKPEKN